MTSIVCFRNDLRTADNPALREAAARGAVVPVFLWSPEEEGTWSPGAASRWWLHHSLVALGEQLNRAGNELLIRRGPASQALLDLAKETGATAVFWNRRYEPAVIARDKALKEALQSAGLKARSFNGALLHEPWTIQNKSGKPFQMFTPFWRTCLAAGEPAAPLPAPSKLPSLRKRPASLRLSELELEPKINWAEGIRGAWQPGTRGAARQLERFLQEAIVQYPEDRNRPDLVGTSRLSPHLHFGEISPRQVWQAVREYAENGGTLEQTWRQWQFVTELGWREFAHHLMFHFPHTPEQPLRSEFARFGWRNTPEWLVAWQRGRTGVPMVDAGMRELWTTGWMHNRVRMIVASFLVKNLLLPWQEGARWFWDTLVDADLANNTLGWQWTAGCGADAAPYFRVFNPVTQGEKYDPNGDYVRRWIPELAGLPNKWIHRPWEAPKPVLGEAGVDLGRTYPAPLVSLTISREVALEAHARMRSAAERVK